jgi:hypothetical protein
MSAELRKRLADLTRARLVVDEKGFDAAALADLYAAALMIEFELTNPFKNGGER